MPNGGWQRLGGRVDDAEHDVAFVERHSHVMRDPFFHRVVAVGIEAAGVDQDIVMPEHPAVGVVPIARHAGDVFDDGDSLSRQSVEERALAHVGPPHDSDDGARTDGAGWQLFTAGFSFATHLLLVRPFSSACALHACSTSVASLRASLGLPVQPGMTLTQSLRKTLRSKKRSIC